MIEWMNDWLNEPVCLSSFLIMALSFRVRVSLCLLLSRSPWVLTTSRTLTSFCLSYVSCSHSLRFLLPFRLEWSRMGPLWSTRVVGRGENENRRCKRWSGMWALSSACLCLPPSYSLVWFLLIALCFCVSVCLLLPALRVSFCLRWVSPSVCGGCFLLLATKSAVRSCPKTELYIKKP